MKTVTLLRILSAGLILNIIINHSAIADRDYGQLSELSTSISKYLEDPQTPEILYIGPNGSDSNIGTDYNNPLKTLKAAYDKIESIDNVITK